MAIENLAPNCWIPKAVNLQLQKFQIRIYQELPLHYGTSGKETGGR